MKREIFKIAVLIMFLAVFTNCHADEQKVYTDSKQNIAQNKVETTQAPYSNSDEVSNSRRNAITVAVDKCSPAIVGINVTETRQVVYQDPFFDDPFFRRFFGNRGRRVQEYQVQGLGSGYIISPDGYILTNHHVAGNASKIVVTMTNGEKYDAEIIGSDMVSDVALLKIKGNNLPYLKLGNSDNIIIGEWVIAFGNPFGLFEVNSKPTVTVGVISNDNIDMIHQDQPYDRVYRDMIQTDAAISSGNSGGPLVNALGEVIGMNTVIYSTAQSQQGAGSIGIGFAIPINRVKTIVDMLKSGAKIDRNYWTGLQVRDMDENLANYIGTSRKEGVVVFGFQRNSPAEQAGFKLGDIILNVDGKKVIKSDDFNVVAEDGMTGQKLNVTVLRDNKEVNLTLILKPNPRK